MTSRYPLVAVFLLALVIFLAGCGGSVQFSSSPNSGQFNNASLSGTYAFSFSGSNGFGFFAMAGTLHANGGGNISAGVLDLNSNGTAFPNVPFTGTYTIRGNGQGTATLFTSFQNFNIDFVVISAQRALVIRFDNNATASGTIDLQNASAFTNAALGGTFAFRLSGVDAGGNAFVSAGAIDNDGNGGIPTGVQDNNDNGIPSPNLALNGAYSVSANGRGTMALNTSTGTLNFAFYVVDPNRLKMVELDGAPVLAGDAFRQQLPQSNATVSGPLAFTLGGSTSGGLPFVVGGTVITDGAGHVTSGFEDINDNGALTQNIALTGTYTIASDGRGTLTVNNSGGTTTFAIYPTLNGVQMVELQTGELSLGTAFAQTQASFSNASIQGSYGMELSGFSNVGEVDSLAQISADGGGGLNGSLDLNDVGTLSTGLILTGNYSVGANGRGTATLRSSFGTQNVIVYVVSNSRVLFIESDSNLVAVGALEHQ